MNSYDLQVWIEMIFRRRRTLLEVFGVVFAIAVVGTILWPPSYLATAKILVQDDRAQLLVSPELQDATPQSRTVVANPISEEDLNSEKELITSVYLVKRAIAGLAAPSVYAGPGSAMLHATGFLLGLPADGYRALHRVPVGDSQDQWAANLARHVSATVIKKSNVLEVSFSAHDQAWSQKFLTLLVGAYLDYHAHISHDPQAQQFFQLQAHLLEIKLLAEEERLRKFQVQTGITSVEDQKKDLVDRMSQLQLQLDRNTADLASADQDAVSFQQMLRQTPQRMSKETRQVQNMALGQLKPQVLQMKAERAELATRYQPDSERIGEIDAKLAAAQKILQQEDHLEVQEKSVDLNPIWVTVESDLNHARAQAASLKASQESLQAEIAATRQQFTAMVNNAMLLGRMQRSLQNAKDAYISYTRKSEEARTAEALNRNRILNVSVAQPATTPSKPASPNVPLNIAVGLILGLGLGLAAAYREDENDPKIYSSAAISDVVGLGTVAVIGDEF